MVKPGPVGQGAGAESGINSHVKIKCRVFARNRMKCLKTKLGEFKMINDDSIVTYEPDNSLKKGYPQIFREIIVEIVSNRWLTYQMFRRNFIAMYKQSFFGILWVIILPIINIAVFAVLNNSGIFNIGDIHVPYPVYAICGLTFWQIFAVGLGSCVNALSSAEDMITRINFSRKSLVFAPMGRTMVSFIIQMMLVGVLLLIYRTAPSIKFLFVPVVVLPILFLTLGFGFILAIMNAIVRDIATILPLAITFLMYLTPVLYAKPSFGLLSRLTEYNPMYHFVAAGRDLILYGQINNVVGFLCSVAFSVVLFVASVLIFHLTETRITERV